MRRRTLLYAGILGLFTSTMPGLTRAGEPLPSVVYANPYVSTPSVVAAPAVDDASRYPQLATIPLTTAPRQPEAIATARVTETPAAPLTALRTATQIANIRAATPATNDSTALRHRSGNRAAATSGTTRTGRKPTATALAILQAAEPKRTPTTATAHVDPQVTAASYAAPIVTAPSAAAGNPLRGMSAPQREANPLR